MKTTEPGVLSDPVWLMGFERVCMSLQTLDERPSLKLLRLLRREYGTALSRDPALGTLMDTVEEVYLGVQRQQGGFGNVLGDIMQMLAAPG